MTPDAFRAHLTRRGYTHVAFAAEMDVERRTVGRWASGKAPVPKAVQMLLEGKTLTNHEDRK